MEDRLLEDYKKAMKDNNEIDKATIQFLRAMVLKERKEKQRPLTDEEIESVIMSERKKRTDALAMFEKANRQDMMEKTYKEIACINRYLPKQMSDYEVEVALKEIIDEIGNDKKNFGQIMGMARAKFGNRADGKTISRILNTLLV